jgi:hypothetical protein
VLVYFEEGNLCKKWFLVIGISNMGVLCGLLSRYRAIHCESMPGLLNVFVCVFSCQRLFIYTNIIVRKCDLELKRKKKSGFITILAFFFGARS